jgi:hypothetical protein
LEEIARFKQEYWRELRRFRAEIEDLATDIALFEDLKTRDLKIKAKMEKLSIQVEDIVAMMKSRNWTNIIFGTILSIIGASIPVAQLNTGSGVMSSVGATTRLVSTVYKAFGPSVSPGVRQQPMAYAALVQKQFSRIRPRDGKY